MELCRFLFYITLHKSSCHTCNEAQYLKNTTPHVQLVHGSFFVAADLKIKTHCLSPLLVLTPHKKQKQKTQNKQKQTQSNNNKNKKLIQVSSILFQPAPSLTGELI